MTNTDATISAYPTSLTAGSFTVIILQTCLHAKSLLNRTKGTQSTFLYSELGLVD